MKTFLGTLDWYGQASPYQPEMRYQCLQDRIVVEFRFNKSVRFDESLAHGQFVEGLWESDVAEFFVSGGGQDYQEVNISPTGAWWSAQFSNYRERSRVSEFDVSIQSKVGSGLWEVRFETALSNLFPWRDCAPQARRISPTAILFDTKPHYFAWNHNSGGEPDFHRADLFKALL